MSTKTKSKAEVVNKHGVKVGQFFTSSWGYDQTNVDFYKVVAVTPAGVKVQKWSNGVIGDNGGPQVNVVPGQGPATYTDWSGVDHSADYWDQKQQKVERDVPVKFHRTNKWGDRPCFTVNSYSSAYLWDGKPQYQTGFGWGH